ncbi:MAG: bifunctional metallophosphatase/5'-nucleotidase [Bacteroidales bacterium]
MKHLLLSICLLFSLSALAQNEDKLVILHTNDTHSQIEAFGEQAGDNKGKAGLARRATAIKQIRKEYKNVLLLDAGDYIQGTPYFNLFNGELEIKAMNMLGYDVATLGNHEFDNGVNFLANMLKSAKFDIISANYDVSKTALKDLIKPYVIKDVNGIKVGIIGLNIKPDGLISDKNFEGIRFLSPIEQANNYAKMLKEEKKVDLVIVLSHLGYQSDPNFSDKKVAEATRNVDIFVGGHSHTYLPEATKIKNMDGQTVLITQSGSKGMNLGKIIYTVFKK